MKRYYHWLKRNAGTAMIECPNGEWMTVTDHKTEIKRLKEDGRCVVEAKEIYHKNWIDEKNKNERLKKEKEWLFKRCVNDWKLAGELLLTEMQQALKKKNG